MPGQSSKLSRGGFDASTLLEEAREEVDSLRCNQLFHSRTPGADWFFPSRVCLQLKYVEQASNTAPLLLKHVRDIPWFIFVFQSIFRIFGSPKNCSRCKFPSMGCEGLLDRFRFIFDSLGGSRNPELQEFRVLEDTEKVLQEIRWVFFAWSYWSCSWAGFCSKVGDLSVSFSTWMYVALCPGHLQVFLQISKRPRWCRHFWLIQLPQPSETFPKPFGEIGCPLGCSTAVDVFWWNPGTDSSYGTCHEMECHMGDGRGWCRYPKMTMFMEHFIGHRWP